MKLWSGITSPKAVQTVTHKQETGGPRAGTACLALWPLHGRFSPLLHRLIKSFLRLSFSPSVIHQVPQETLQGFICCQRVHYASGGHWVST
jgi:hypothetical protein